MLKTFFSFLVVVLALSAADASAFFGSDKIALVIGNSRYDFAPLRNPANDARDISKALEEVGFEVTTLTDVSLKDLQSHLTDFNDRLESAGGIGLFYYAGHAVQVRDVNYLLPVDIRISNTVALADTAVRLDDVMNIMENAGNEANIVILDACRNNPFDGYVESDSSSGSLTRAVRGVKVEKPTGLADVQSFPRTFIAYATAPNKTAADGRGRNGMYTKHLLQHINTEGLDIETVFKRVRKGVLRESNGKQIPWERSSLLEDFYFIKPKREGGKRRLFGAF